MGTPRAERGGLGVPCSFQPRGIVFMNSNTIGLALMTLILLTGTALGAPPSESGEGSGGGLEEQAASRIEERLQRLHQELALTANQEAAWRIWAEKMQAAKQDRKAARPDLEALRQMTAIQRLEKLLAFGAARQAAMAEMLAATRSFYASLSPGQQKIFDDLAPFGARGPKWGAAQTEEPAQRRH